MERSMSFTRRKRPMVLSLKDISTLVEDFQYFHLDRSITCLS